jgi:uncharacterized protein (TIGR03084 family)
VGDDATVAADLDTILDDLEAEEQDLARVLGTLADDEWDTPTPAKGWRVRHQISHLADGEELARLSLSDPDAFEARLAEMLADPGAVARAADKRATAPPAALARRWDGARRATLSALRARSSGDRTMWVTGPMSSASFATARLMETWAHGQDIADAIGLQRIATARLRHIAHLGVATRGFSFTNRGLEAPDAEVRVELEAPGGTTWSWGPAAATERVTGPAIDFCRVVTQRRNVADTTLVATGETGRRWLEIAQCFAGPPTDARPPAGMG